MDNEEKINDYKFPTDLNILLFIHFTIWFFESYGSISHYLTFGFDETADYNFTMWSNTIINIVAGLYSGYAVIKTLREDKDCITALKFASIILFLYTLLKPDTIAAMTKDLTTMQVILLFFRPLFYLIFLIYLYRSKTIKETFPKAERKFAPAGWIWIGIIFASILTVAYGFYKTYEYADYCDFTDISTLDLKDSEVSDKCIIFNSDRHWEKVGTDVDTIFDEYSVVTEPTLISKDSLSTICLSSGIVVGEPDMRKFNSIIALALKQIDPAFRNSFRKISELSLTDTVVNGNRLKSSIFMVEKDSEQTYYNVVLITDSIYPKSSIFVRMDKEKIAPEWSINLAKSVKFNLKQILETKNNVRSNGQKEK